MAANSTRRIQPRKKVRATETGAANNATLRAYNELKAQILNNQLPPGTSYLEQNLAEKLGMSRTPVREALIRLADERLVEVRPRHGIRVLPISLKDMADIYEILTVLEALAARRAAEIGPTMQEISALEAAVSDMDAALARNDLVAWSAADTTFHDLLIAASRNDRLVNSVKLCLDQVHRARQHTLHLRPKPITSNTDHRAVVAAIKARNPETAHQIHHNHRAAAGRLLLDLLSQSERDEF